MQSICQSERERKSKGQREGERKGEERKGEKIIEREWKKENEKRQGTERKEAKNQPSQAIPSEGGTVGGRNGGGGSRGKARRRITVALAVCPDRAVIWTDGSTKRSSPYVACFIITHYFQVGQNAVNTL